MSTILRVGDRPEPFEAMAEYFDGLSPEPKLVRVSSDDAQATLDIQGEGVAEHWAYEEIREVPGQARKDLMVLHMRSDPVARLVMDDRRLAPRLPNLDHPPPTANRGRLLGWAAAALASVFVIIFVLVPRMADQLANYIPPEGEQALGEVTLEQIRDALDQSGFNPVPFCEQPEGLAALRKMERRLVGTSDLALSVQVLNHDLVNAFALPGGNIVFFKGLIDAAETPEQVAAVLAHEIGHVVSRDPTRHALRSAGSIGVLGLIFGDFAGGALVLFLAERLIDAQYSQGAEAAADEFAHRMMIEAELAPSALSDMFKAFKALGEEPGGLLEHFMNHPSLGDRIEAARTATPSDLTPKPLLTEAEWAALQQICD